MTKPRREAPLLLLLTGVLATLFLLELTIGAVRIPWTSVLGFLTTGHTAELSWERILFIARMPRAINAMASGAALGVCGVLLQTLFRNSLADPYVLGTVHGARFGVALLLALAGAETSLGIPAAATLGASLATAILALISRRLERAGLLIFGLMLGFLFLALVDGTLHFAGDAQSAVFHFWDHGGFAGATWDRLSVMLPLLAVGALLATTQIKALNVLIVSEIYAASLGISVGRARLICLTAAALLAGVVTAYSGPVAFLGLVVALWARALTKTADHRRLLPAALLLGAVLAEAADFVVHLPWAGEPPHLDAMLGILGAPAVMISLYRNKSRGSLSL